MWSRALWIAAVCFLSGIHNSHGLEGSLFYLTFLRNHNQINTLQEILVSSSSDGEVKIEYNDPLYYTETVQLNSNNSWHYARRIDTAETEFCPPFNVITKAAIVISSTMNISVQANSGRSGSGDGYLSLPLTSSSTRFYLASFLSNVENMYTEFSIVSPYNDTTVTVANVSGSTSIEFLKLTMSENEVHQSGSLTPADFTGFYVTSDKPIAVFSGHSCSNVPEDVLFCDHLIEQMPPVSQWGKTFIMASFHGRVYRAGFTIRVIAQASTDVQYWSQTYDSNNDPLDFTLFRSVNLNNGQWDEADIGSASNIVTVLVNCSVDCLVIQYNKGATAGSPSDIGQSDPFMIVAPSLDHYTNNIRFSTSQYMDEVVKDFVNGITIIAKTAELEEIYLDNDQIINIAGGVQYGIKVSEWTSYTAVIAPLDPGVHSVTSENPDVTYTAFVYGHGQDEDAMSYGYLGGYAYNAYAENCGDLLHSTPYTPIDGWTKLCEISTSDTTRVDTPCYDLLQGLPVYENATGLLQAGGNFGCWLSSNYPENSKQACYDGLQHYHTLGSCLDCSHLVVCIKYPTELKLIEP